MFKFGVFLAASLGTTMLSTTARASAWTVLRDTVTKPFVDAVVSTTEVEHAGERIHEIVTDMQEDLATKKALEETEEKLKKAEAERDEANRKVSEIETTLNNYVTSTNAEVERLKHTVQGEAAKAEFIAIAERHAQCFRDIGGDADPATLEEALTGTRECYAIFRNEVNILVKI